MKHILSNRLENMKYPKIREIFDRVATFNNVISLGMGEPDFHTDSTIINKAFQDVKENHYTHYTPTPGFRDLREAISRKLSENENLPIEADEVIITPGAQNALINALFTLVDPGDEIMVPDPYYPSYISQIELSGANPIFIPTFERNNFKLSAMEIEKRITKKTKVIIINSPNNPTGAVLEKIDLEKIDQVIINNGLMVISDEAYETLVYDNINHLSIASLPKMKERTIIVRSFSKSFAMTGWRVGYAIAKKEIIDNMMKYSGYTLSCPPAISQRAALIALTESKNLVENMKEEYKKRRDFTIEALNKINGISCIMPKGTFYAFPNITKTGKCSEEIYDKLLLNGRVAVIPGSAFGEQGEGYLRIAYTVPIENLREAMDRIRKVFNKIL